MKKSGKETIEYREITLATIDDEFHKTRVIERIIEMEGKGKGLCLIKIKLANGSSSSAHFVTLDLLKKFHQFETVRS